MKEYITAASLVLDVGNGSHCPPVNRTRQFVSLRSLMPDTEPLAMPLRYLGPQVRPSVLLIGQVSEPVQTETVRVVLSIMLVNELKVVLENLEPGLLLP